MTFQSFIGGGRPHNVSFCIPKVRLNTSHYTVLDLIDYLKHKIKTLRNETGNTLTITYYASVLSLHYR